MASYAECVPSTQHWSIDPQSSKTSLRPKGESFFLFIFRRAHILGQRLTSVLIFDDKIDGASLNPPYINNIHLLLARAWMCVCLCPRSRTIDRPSCTRWKFYNHQSVIGIEQLIHVTGGVLSAIAIVCSNEMQADDSRQNVGYSIIIMPKSKSVLFKQRKLVVHVLLKWDSSRVIDKKLLFGSQNPTGISVKAFLTSVHPARLQQQKLKASTTSKLHNKFDSLHVWPWLLLL